MSTSSNLENGTPDTRIQAIQHILASIFAAQNALRTLAPEYAWKGLGNLLGDFGECVATAHYGLTKAPCGAGGHDAVTLDNQTVQIKTNHASRDIGFRGEADLLLVLQVSTDGTWQELYFGPFAAVKAIARYSQRDNKFMVPVSKLKPLNSAMKSEGSIAA
jgi:hypothetical protein